LNNYTRLYLPPSIFKEGSPERKTMKKFMLKSTASIMAVAFALSSSAFADDIPAKEELWKMLQKQQQEIAELKKIAAKNAKKAKATEKKIDATSTAIEAVASNPSVSHSATSIGGYGELHYNGGKKPTVDFHRFVLFIGHEFSNSIRFFSELEVEHSIAGHGKVGEVELEQAFVEFDISENHKISTGLMLIPVGILNETHEPPTFYGLERNNVEKHIIPATWWEAGIKFSGNLNEKLSYDVMVSSGLDTIGKPYNIRSGRKKVGKAPWESTAYTARLTWKPAAGIEIGGTFQYQSDLIQDRTIDAVSNSATLFEVHANVNHQVTENGTFSLRALYASWNIRGTEPKVKGMDLQNGFYIEPSYKIHFDNDTSVGFFVRYSTWDNNAGNDISTAYRQTNFGINYWPTEDVVFKVDYQVDNFDNESKEDNRINIGMGLQF
jgi:hypothetical protein